MLDDYVWYSLYFCLLEGSFPRFCVTRPRFLLPVVGESRWRLLRGIVKCAASVAHDPPASPFAEAVATG